MTDAADGLMVTRPATSEETPVQIRLAVPLSKPDKVRTAREFILKYHYSKTVPTGKNIYFGCYVNDELFAVANYASLASRTPPDIILNRPDANRSNTLELRRLCRVGEKGEPGPVKLSDFLRECHDSLRIQGYRYILSYSDRAYNQFKHQHRNAKHKSGGIYKFSGFEYIGETPKEWHIKDKDGNQFHRSRAYRKMLAHNIALCAKLNFPLKRKTTGNRDRYWPKDEKLWATDASLPADKLWKLDQVRTAMGYTRFECPPKDKWLLDLDG